MRLQTSFSSQISWLAKIEDLIAPHLGGWGVKKGWISQSSLKLTKYNYLILNQIIIISFEWSSVYEVE